MVLATHSVVLRPSGSALVIALPLVASLVAFVTTQPSCHTETRAGRSAAAAGAPREISREQLYGGVLVETPPADPDEAALSLEACEQSLRELSAREAAESPDDGDGKARVLSLNVRWFPDNALDPAERDQGTDVRWLSCIIAQSRAPVVAVQEFRTHPHARARTRELLDWLNQRTGGRWRSELDRCPNGEDNHVGFLFDERRVVARGFANLDALSPAGGCSRDLHPGFAASFRYPGGFDATFVSVHFMWGTTPQSLSWRRQAREQLTSALRDAPRPFGGDDFVVLGDFNTNGCTECGRDYPPEAEVAELGRSAAAVTPPLTLLPLDQRCTEYDNGTPLPLDHVLISRGLREAPAGLVVQVAGPCRQRGCARADRDFGAYHERISDHCPLLVEFTDRDLDP